jgi:hypothetical protein
MTWKQVKPAAGNGSAAKKTGETKQPIQRRRHMKKFVLLIAVAATLAFAAGNTRADLILNVSGTAKVGDVEGAYKGNYTTHSFSEKDVYTLISNALVNVTNFDTAIAQVHVPANGYIAFNPGAYDEGPDDGGIFYVTNKTGYYHPLSGYDTNDNYYSFIELDTVIFYDNYEDNQEDEDLFLGFEDYYYYPFQANVANYNVASTGSNRGNGSSTAESVGILYIHDDPTYGNYDDADNPNVVSGEDNENAIEIRGVVSANFTIKDYDEIKSGSLSISGSGNFFIYDYEFWGIVSSATAKLTP